jgi:membrane protein DedA with SNARE-associated domain
MSIETIIINLSYLGIFLLMISNGLITTPSSQVLYIITGYFISTGALNLWIVLIVGALGNTIGNIILYEIARQKGMKYITRLKFFPEQEIKKMQIVFRKRGVWFVFIGKLVPALKVWVPIPAGIAKMNRAVFIPIIFVSSVIWAGIFNAIGFAFGKSTTVFAIYAPVLLIIAFIVLFIFYRYMNSKEVLRELRK